MGNKKTEALLIKIEKTRAAIESLVKHSNKEDNVESLKDQIDCFSQLKSL